MSSSDPCIHSPLTLPSNIRVIYIEPGSHDEPLSLSLAAVSLNTPYRALSYVWGEDVDRPTIFLDGKHFQITINLHALLKELRCCDTRAGPFWAEAICTNQSDDVEKRKQVSMMGKIYGKTGRCLVWLGEEEEGMDEAFRLFKNLADQATELDDDVPEDRKQAIVEGWNETPTSKGANLLALRKSTTFQRQIYDEFLAAALPIDPPQSQVARSLRAWELGCTIWKRDWFTRTWTLQEFVLPVAIEIRCGSLTMDADSMVICGRIYSVVYGFPIAGPPLGLDNSGFPRFTQTTTIRSLSSLYCHITTKKHLVERVAENRQRAASDPRDKIYGVLALDQTPVLQADYSKSVSQVYIQFAIWCVGEGRLSQLWQCVGPPLVIPAESDLHGLPGWVPDWSRTGNRNHALSGGQYSGAGASMASKIVFSQDPYSMVIEGVILGRISSIIAISPSDADYEAATKSLRDELPGDHPPQTDDQKWAERGSQLKYVWSSTQHRVCTAIPYSILLKHLQSREEAIFRTIVADLDQGDKRLGPEAYTPDNPWENYRCRGNLMVTSNGHLGLTNEHTT